MWHKIIKYKFFISIVLLFIFYSIGLLGAFLFDNPIEFFSKTPMNLLISFALLIWNHQDWSNKIVASLITVAFAGYLVEAVGVNTGLIFGQYSYGSTLGYKVFETPLMIGINWILLTYLAIYSFSEIIQNIWLLSFFCGFILVFLDFLIEPVAIAYDFWTWEGQGIPTQNYIAWYICSVILCFVIAKHKEKSHNKIAPVLFVIQFVFFGILNTLLWNS